MSDVKFDYSGKVALVTGASSGIGRETALMLAGSGASVVVSDINEKQGREVLDEIESHGGRAVFIKCDVSSAKHAVAGLTKTAALEYAEANIRVNAVCPGPIMTPMLERIMSTAPGFKEQLLAGVPEHRIGTPANVADCILYLCSEQAAYITGQCIAIDGGWVAQ